MNRRIQITFGLGLFLTAVFINSLLFAQDGLRLDIKEYHLKNGLQVLVLEDHAAPVITVQVWCRAGSRNERPGITGVSHVLEHMMFKGTKKRGAEEYDEIVQRHGGISNAFTSNDMTAYFSILPSTKVELAFDLEGDRFNRPIFREFLPERDVVKEERRLGENDPQDRLYEELMATAFKAHPYSNPVIGWMSDLSALTEQDMENYFHTYYSPSNLSLVIVGDVAEEEALKLAKKYFGKIKKRDAPPPMRTVEPEQIGERRVEVHREAFLPVVGIAYHIPEYVNPKSPTFQVISRILASGESSRLYQRLVYKSRWQPMFMDRQTQE
jgi:zinc protease